jgi:hypothetical protein
MKVTRYSASGTTQRKGTLAMFWVMWLVTARSITEPIADKASHRSCLVAVGFEAAWESWIAGAAPLADISATTPHSTAKPANRNDQPQPRTFRSNAGSNSTGKPSSASRDAKLESANRR